MRLMYVILNAFMASETVLSGAPNLLVIEVLSLGKNYVFSHVFSQPPSFPQFGVQTMVQ